MLPKLSKPTRLYHLPLLMDVVRRMKLLQVIDQTIKDDPRCKVKTSDCLSVMLCAIFSGAHDLYRVRERLSRFDMKTIMRDAHFNIEEFTEERLAKALDDIWSHGPDRIITAIAVQMITAFHIQTQYFHFDTTSLTCRGAYEDEDKELSEYGDVPPLVTYGHSKDKRPDLKQVLYGTMVSADGGVPVFGQVLDGNQSDNISTALFFARVRNLVQDPREVVCVADSKGWCGRVVDMMSREKMRLLSRLPRNHKVHQEIMEMEWKPAGTIAIKNKRRQSEAPETYEYFGCDVETQFEVVHAEQESKAKEIIRVPARAVRVFSSALLKKKLSTLNRVKIREQRMALKFIRDRQKRAFACEDDARRAATRDKREQKYVTIDLHTSIIFHDGAYKTGRGRPAKRKEPSITVPHWRIVYTTTEVTQDKSHERLKDSASFVIIRTLTNGWQISDADMIMRYKGQYLNEHGFSWLKSGAVMNPIFLKTSHRIASLGFVYCIGLMIWTIIQRTVRQGLHKHGMKLPHYNRRLTANITTRFIFELFQEVQSQEMILDDGKRHAFVHGLTAHTARACRSLGTKLSVFRPLLGVA